MRSRIGRGAARQVSSALAGINTVALPDDRILVDSPGYRRCFCFEFPLRYGGKSPRCGSWLDGGILGVMRLEHYPVEKLKQEILAIVGRHLDLTTYRVFFFGSRVMGKGTDRSDIDVGIEGPEPIPTRAWAEIQEGIENLPTLYKIEIVDFRHVAPIFKEVALQHTESIWEPHADKVPSGA